jgi:hypothetical protein
MAQIMKGSCAKMKKLFLLFVFFLFLYGMFSSSEAVVDRVVAVVNQEMITLSEVEKLVNPFQEQIVAEDRLEKRDRILNKITN